MSRVDAVGGVLDDGAGVDVEVGAGGLGLGRGAGPAGPGGARAGRRRAWGARWRAKARRRPKLRASSAAPPLGEQLGEELPAGVGDPVDLAAPPGPGGGVPAGPQDGPLAAQRAGRRGAGGRRAGVAAPAPSVATTAPDFSSRVRAG